jgi:hypothetical protein
MVVEGASLPEASGQRRRCPVGGRCNGGADRSRGFPALGRYEKDYATYGYDYGTRNPEQTYSTPDLCVSADASRN